MIIYGTAKTIYELDITAAMRAGYPYEVLPNTTLNEKHDINKTVKKVAGKYPTYKYLAIGVGGEDFIPENTGYSCSNHTGADAALFEQIPFVLKPIGSDITVAEQQHYRFKKRISVNGVEYYAYYLKCIDVVYEPGFYTLDTSITSQDTGEPSPIASFSTNTSELLNPVPFNRQLDRLDSTESRYIVKMIHADFILTETEQTYLEEVFKILYPDPAVKTRNIRELAVCSGIDTHATDGNVEAAMVQVSFYYTVDIPFTLDMVQRNVYYRKIELGGMEPLPVKQTT